MGEHLHRPTPKNVAEAPTKKATPAPAAKPRRREPPDLRSASEKRAERSDNATYVAMNWKLKLLAYELGAARERFRFAIATSTPSGIADTQARLGQIAARLEDLVFETDMQFKTLVTPKGEPRLTDGALALTAALDELEPVVIEIDAWMTSHKKERLPLEFVRRGRANVARVFPGILPAARPLAPMEKNPGFVRDASIDAHLDAAIVAAESMKEEPIIYSDRAIVHAKELAELLKGHPRVEGQLETRIKKLVVLVEQRAFDNPYLEKSLHEAIDPIRTVK